MDSQVYIKEIRSIQNSLLNYIDEESESNDLFQAMIKLINQLKILEDQADFKSFLYLISRISNEHHRFPSFFSKIEKILLNFKDEIQRFYSNSDIFNIFYSNKRILLFLIQSDIIKIDEYVLSQIQDQKYSQFFSPEIKRFVKSDEKDEESKESSEEFERKRLTGENDSYLCQLIRQDSIDEFIEYMSKTNSPLEGQIPPSIFETNLFLIDNNPTIIEYAAFFGSIKIFQYLKVNNVSLKHPLCLYSIHGNNAEIINIIEENSYPKEQLYTSCFEEAIKCYNRELANYFDENLTNFSEDVKNTFGIKYYNYEYIEKIDFFGVCCLNNIAIAEKLICSGNVDINALKILQKNFFF